MNWAWLIILLLGADVARGAEKRALERSYWIHASLGLFTQQNYFGTNFPTTGMPEKTQVANAARLLTGEYGANRLYLIYHREISLGEARQLFTWWRAATPAAVEIVPALVLRMYDQGRTPVFTTNELAGLADFFRAQNISTNLAVYDIAARENQPTAMAVLSQKYPGGLFRLGMQPGESLNASFTAGVQDTWSAVCHGKRNEEDWSQPGFGAATLKQWVVARNFGSQPVTWNLVTVAWDYAATERGGYPGYDDADKNMALPTGRNRLAAALIRSEANPKTFAGFSSDLYILHENSRSMKHDGKAGSFYECLKRGEVYHGFYAGPLREITDIYREMKVRNE